MRKLAVVLSTVGLFAAFGGTTSSFAAASCPAPGATSQNRDAQGNLKGDDAVVPGQPAYNNSNATGASGEQGFIEVTRSGNVRGSRPDGSTNGSVGAGGACLNGTSIA